MDSLIAAAARALGVGDAVGARREQCPPHRPGERRSARAARDAARHRRQRARVGRRRQVLLRRRIDRQGTRREATESAYAERTFALISALGVPAEAERAGHRGS